MNTITTKLEFVSRECKNKNHNQCCGLWHGLGFEVICRCECNHFEKQGLEQQVVQPACSNTLSQSSQQQEVVLLDD